MVQPRQGQPIEGRSNPGSALGNAIETNYRLLLKFWPTSYLNMSIWRLQLDWYDSSFLRLFKESNNIPELGRSLSAPSGSPMSRYDCRRHHYVYILCTNSSEKKNREKFKCYRQHWTLGWIKLRPSPGGRRPTLQYFIRQCTKVSQERRPSIRMPMIKYY